MVIGGGITGAGIMRESARCGLRVLLVEQNDFASGTSSRSSKLIHGGVHYLARCQVGMVRDAVRERENLIRSDSGLVGRFDIIVPAYARALLPLPLMAAGIGFYELLAGRLPRNLRLTPSQVMALGINRVLLRQVFRYSEAGADDARLVLRVLQEGCRLGGWAVNQVAVQDLLRDTNGTVVGVRARDCESGFCADLRARVVINATGPWADQWNGNLGSNLRVRLVRGSHLVLPRARLPLDHAIGFLHPNSNQLVAFFPWEGKTIVGTTNVKHGDGLARDPRISPDEAAYLWSAVGILFPESHLTPRDILSTYAGVRPIVDNQTQDPAMASREYSISERAGMFSVTGGKLTTFRVMALKTLRKLRKRFPELKSIDSAAPILEKVEPIPDGLSLLRTTSRRLAARYGAEGLDAIAHAPEAEQELIEGMGVSRAEVRWVIQREAVRHLDDLMLRRFRIGLTTQGGGISLLPELRPIIQTEMNWDEARWKDEEAAYAERWKAAHGVPDFSAPPSTAR